MRYISEQYADYFFKNIPLDSPRSKSHDEYAKEKTKIFSEFLKLHNYKLMRLLTAGHYLNHCLGSQAEDLFVVPRKIDNAMGIYFPGITCVEKPDYDLIFSSNILISNKSRRYIFHTKKREVVNPSGKTSIPIPLFNTRGAGNIRKNYPVFDCLLIFQFIPFLVCAVGAYPDVYPSFNPDGNIYSIPFSSLTFVLSPYHMIHPLKFTPEDCVRMLKEIENIRFSDTIDHYMRETI